MNATSLDHLRPHHAGHLRFADRQLGLHAIARCAIDAPQHDHVAQVVLPMAEEIAVPEVVRKVAEAQVETLRRHVGGERLDLDALRHRQLQAAATSAAGAAARPPLAATPNRPSTRSRSIGAWYASFAVSCATHEPPIFSRPNRCEPRIGHLAAEPAGPIGRQIVLDDDRILGVAVHLFVAVADRVPPIVERARRNRRGPARARS